MSRWLVVLLLCAFPLLAAADDLAERAAALGRVQDQIARVQRELDRERGQRDAQQRALQDSAHELARATGELEELQAQVRAQAAQVEAARERAQHAADALGRQRAALARQVRLAFELGEGSRTRLLLSLEEPALLSRMMTWFGYLNEARMARIREIREQLQALVELRRALDQELAKLHELEDAARQRVDARAARRRERSQALAALEARIRSQGRELGQLQADERDLQQLIETLRDKLADIPDELPGDTPFAELKGGLPWPVQGRLLARFGQSKAGGKLKWNGIWIGAEEGQAVHAVAGGRVAYVGWMHRYGLILVIEQGDGYYTLYGHNKSVEKSAGEWVRPGETIAAVGRTGGQDRAGLYFEVRKGADPIDPVGWIERR